MIFQSCWSYYKNKYDLFGTKKCNDTKKAERFFKERGIKYQFIDMKEKGMSKGEFTSEKIKKYRSLLRRLVFFYYVI